MTGNTVEITELPVKKWTQDYREFLEELVKGDKKETKALLEDYQEHHTERTAHFTCVLTPEGVEAAKNQGLEKMFKLRSSERKYTWRERRNWWTNSVSSVRFSRRRRASS